MYIAYLLRIIAAVTLPLSLPATPMWAEENGRLRLAERGHTPYCIVIAKDASSYASLAAEELRVHFKQITGAEIPIVTDAQPITEWEILVGPSSHLQQISAGMDVDSLADEEYWIKTVGNYLVIGGGPRRGVLHGVWAFLEEDLGCRWFTPDVSVIPKDANLSIGPIDRRYVPPFECRSVWSYNPESDPVWAARMHLNTFVRHMTDAQGRPAWSGFFHHPLIEGSWYWAEHSSHTFPRLVPVGQFYDEHPEYFALVDGKRVRKQGQLCMTNPDVAKIAAQWANSRLDWEPEAKLVSISADDLGNFCQCENCTAARERYPETKRQQICGQAAVLVPFVNDVAKRVEKEHPDALVTTLAYQWTRIPAAALPVRSNVVIRYCPIEVCVMHALDDPSCGWNMKNYQGTRFLDELTTWTKIAPRVWIWYYALDRKGALQPGLALKTASANFRLFDRLGVKGVQVQARVGPNVPWSPLQHLKSYIFAKLTWQPQFNVAQGVHEFCRAYYGAAGEQMEAYVWALHELDTYERTATGYLKDVPGIHAGVTESCTPIKDERLMEFDAWFDAAEEAVAGDEGLLRRVGVIRMTLQYAILLHMEKEHPLREKALAGFLGFARQIGVEQVLDPASDTLVALDEFEELASKGPLMDG